MKIYSDEMIKGKIERQKKRRKIVRCVFYPAALFIVICAMSILYQKAVRKEDDTHLFGFRSYIVLSGSMEPCLQVGDMVVSRQVGGEQIETGDIITFEDENGAIITHRVTDLIIKDGKRYYQTKGDHNNAKDTGLIPIDNIKGKYIFKIDGAGKIITKAATPAGFMFMIFILTMGYITVSKKSDRKIARHVIRERYKKQSVIEK